MMNCILNQTLRRAALVSAAIAAMACSRDLVEMEAPAPVDVPSSEVITRGTVRFSGELVSTKARFGEKEGDAYPTLWTANDAQLKLSLNYGSAKPADITPTEDFLSATFHADFDFTAVDGPFTFYAVSPASAAQALSPSRSAWKVTIPCEQTPAEGSVDEAGIILAATSASYTEVTTADVVDFHFDHLTAYGRVSFTGLSLANGETVQAVEMTATTPFVGDWYWSCGDGHALLDYGASSTLTLHTSRTSDIWFACAPVDMSEQLMTISVITNAGIFEKLVEFPTNRKFEAGRSAVFTVDMSEADYTARGSGSAAGSFERVTDALSLRSGDEVLIVYPDGGVALGDLSSNGNYRISTGVTLSGNTIASAGDAAVLTLCTGSTSGSWAFKDGNNYLASPSTNNNYLKNTTSVTANASWTVSIDSNGLATIIATAGNRTYLRYNSGSPRFSCYQDASIANTHTPAIYRRTSGSGAALTDPLLAHSEYGCYLGTGLTHTLVSGIDQVTRAYNASGVLTYTLIDPSTVEELEISGYKKSCVKGDTFTVTVSWRKGSDSLLSASYEVRVIKEEGPKVWLSAGDGKGFIIKK